MSAKKPKAKKSKKSNGRAKEPAAHVKVPKGSVERGGRYTKQLTVPINAAELDKCTAELVACVREQEALDEKRRETLAGFRQKQESIKERQKTLVDSVEGHTRLENVECQDYLTPQNEIRTIRLDTGEIVNKRAAVASELQESLLDEEEEHEDEEEDETDPGDPEGDDGAAGDPLEEGEGA